MFSATADRFATAIATAGALPTMDLQKGRTAKGPKGVPGLLAERRRNREIAEILGISPHTAERHTENVLMKLGVHSRDDVRDRMAPPMDATDAATTTR